MKNRYYVGIGSTLKLGKITTLTDANGVPMWNFVVPYMQERNGELVTYYWEKICVRGKCEFKTGDVVRVTKIDSHCVTPVRTKTGGFYIASSLWCEVKGAKKKWNK